MVGSRISHLLADMDLSIFDAGKGRSVYQTVDKWCGRILINLLNPPSELIVRLSPVVIFHRDDKNLLDLLSVGAQGAQCGYQCEHTQHSETSEEQHRNLQGYICGAIRYWSVKLTPRTRRLAI